MDKQEIKIVYHILDHVFPDLERNDFQRYELKPPERREYVDNISLSEEEYRRLVELKRKMAGSLLSGLTARRGEEPGGGDHVR